MPYIDSKITMKVSKEKQEAIKTRFGRDIAILGKPETYLMVGIQDEYSLFFGGKQLDMGAFVDVRLLGNASSEMYEKMTGAICKTLGEELGIPSENIYVTYQGLKDWGWNGTNF